MTDPVRIRSQPDSSKVRVGNIPDEVVTGPAGLNQPGYHKSEKDV
jgi:hypothetical protein